jgi:DnaK suppressor protein
MRSHARTSRRNAGLPREELAVLRAKLLEQRAFRREQLVGIHQRPGEPEHHGAARAEVRGYLAVAARIVLADVEAALDRMETGHYGQCRACRGPVEPARLRICPQTLYCGECHRLQEVDR